MPKMKTHSATKKRFSFTATGKIKRNCANKNHILTKKTTKRTRKLRQGSFVDGTQVKEYNRLMPYGKK